jgi:choline dehydrogenase-like flavoprotein
MSSIPEDLVIGGPGALPDAEVCVVGAGPAGIALAHALGRAGRRVTLLDSGRAGSSPLAQELNDGDVQGEQQYAGLRKTRYRGFGGTANIWNVEVDGQRGAKYAPLDPRDLESWPLGWTEIEPFYREAQEVCGLGRFAYDADEWASEGRHPFDTSGTGLVSRVYHFGLADRFARELMGELEAMENVRIVPSATVAALSVDDSGRRVRGVRVVHESGSVFEARAKRVVLACGAVENARLLLLASGAGATVASRWLGRGFMEHARDFSLVLVPDSPEVFADAAFYDLHTTACGARIGGRLAIAADAQERFGLPNASMTLIPGKGGRSRFASVKRVLRRVAGIRGRGGRYGWSEKPASPGRFEVFRIVLNVEQRPDPGNRIELGERCDRFGNRLPLLHLEWTAGEQERLDRLRESLGDWFLSARLGRLRFDRGRPPDLSAHHHAGTTRMAERPEDGVADPDGAVFGIENLYVMGGSLFPAAGFANPTLTIVALARRLARHLLSL